jgi:tetratricopeptide (TPR) repeat protein
MIAGRRGDGVASIVRGAAATCLIFAGLVFAIGCGGAAATKPVPESSQPVVRRPPSPLVVTLTESAEAALTKGDLARAEGKYRRILSLDPDSRTARVGLSRIAAARGDGQTQRELLAEVIALDPGDSGALNELAQLEIAAGRRGAARDLFARALERRPLDPELLEGMLAVTGAASASQGATAEEVMLAAEHHPLDPAARLAAAKVAIERGEMAVARDHLLACYWMTDLNPQAAAASLRLLGEIDEEWAARRIVPVHVFADETIRRHPGWRMRLRIEWLKVSYTMDSLLRTAFLPVSIKPFSSDQVTSNELGAIKYAWLSGLRSAPRNGIMMAFTERPPPRRQGARLGEAQLLGRVSIVRLEPEESGSRVLIHELFHLYGGVHVSPDIHSLMNPSGNSLALDPVNRGIAELTRERLFTGRGPEVDLYPFIATDELIGVYDRALRVNMAIRQRGLGEARAAQKDSRYLAGDIARQALGMDTDLAQVAQMIGDFMARDRAYAGGATYYDLAAELFDPRSPQGQAAMTRAEEMRRYSQHIYGTGTGSGD